MEKTKFYRLKKEALPFFPKAFHTETLTIDKWNDKGIYAQALMEVEPAYITYGIKTSEIASSLSSYTGNPRGIEIHFTINIPSGTHEDYIEMKDNSIIRELMDRFQKIINDEYEFEN